MATDWTQDWHLPSIPDPEFASEHGRRNAAKRKVRAGGRKAVKDDEAAKKNRERVRRFRAKATEE